MTYEQRIKQLEHALQTIADMVDGYVDVEDGNDGQPRPNIFMKIRTYIDEVL